MKKILYISVLLFCALTMHGQQIGVDNQVQRILQPVNGGTGAQPSAANQLPIISSFPSLNTAVGLWITIPDTTSGGLALGFNQTTHQFTTVSAGGGGSITWPASADLVISNGTNSPLGLAPVNGDCVVASGGAWVAGSCGGGTSTCGALSGDATSTNCGNNNLTSNTATKVQTFGYTNLNYGNGVNGSMAFGAENLNNAAPVLATPPLVALGYGNGNFPGVASQYQVLVGTMNFNGATSHPCNTQNVVAVGRGNLNPCGEVGTGGAPLNSDVVAVGDQNLAFVATNTFRLSEVVSVGSVGYATLATGGTFQNTVGVGDSPINNLSGGSDLVAIGDTDLSGTVDTANVSDIVAIGDSAGSGLVNGTNTVVSIGLATTNTVSGSEIIGIGDASGDNNTGTDVIAIGDIPVSGSATAVIANSGHDVIAIGNSAAANTTTGHDIIAIGDFPLAGSITPRIVNTGSEIIAIGDLALPVNTTGSNNIAIGYQAGGVGFVSASSIGSSNQTGGNNTWIGYQSGPSTSTQISNTLAIGYQAQNNNSNQMVIGNSTMTALLIPGIAPSSGGPNCLQISTAGAITQTGSACGGGSGGAASTVASAEVVTFSATPTFSTTTNVSRIVLTANITSFTLGAGSDGQDKTLCFKQGSGPYSVAPPTNVHGFFTVGTVNAEWNCQTFAYDNTDSIWLATGLGVTNQ